jgi:AcrR family transcriptional regulator
LTPLLLSDRRSVCYTDHGTRKAAGTAAETEGQTAPRAVNPHKHAARRDEFLDAGQRLIQTRGYEQFSIEELLAAVGASKGAFYHYFGSKQALLEAIVDRLVDMALTRVAPVMNDTSTSALDKFRGFFHEIAALKAEHREFVVQLIQVWYSDDNALVREKLRREQIHRVTPHIAAIIRQGVSEGTFALADPDQMARVVLALILDTGDEAGELYVARHSGTIDFETVARRLDTYQRALERLLGVEPGALQLIDRETLRTWFGDQGKEN